METTKKNRSIYHWVILICCILTLMFAYAPRIGLAQLFSAEVLKDTGYSSGAYFLCSTFASIGAMISSPIAGKLLKGKYMRITFIASCLLTMGIYSLYGACHALWQFYIVGFLQGFFAMGCCTLPVSVIITNWFEKNRGLMISIAMMGISIGGTVLSPVITAMIAANGWRTAYFMMGALSLIVLLPIGIFVMRRTPEDAGLLPYGQGETVTAKKTGTKASASPASFNLSLKEAKGMAFFWLFILGAFLAYVTSCILGHMAIYVNQSGFDATMVATFVSLYSFVAIFGKLILGYVYDRFGTVGGILFGNGAWLLFLICFLFIQDNAPMLYASAVFYGIGTCITTVGTPIIVSSVFGKKNYSEIYGFVSSFTMFGSAVGTSVIGFMYDAFGSYQPVLVALLLLSILMTAAYLICIKVSRNKAAAESNVAAA